MKNVIFLALSLLSVGIFVSVSLLGPYQILMAIPALYFCKMSYEKKAFHLPKSSLFLLGFCVVALISSGFNHDILVRASKNYGSVKQPLLAIFSIGALSWYIQEESIKRIGFILRLFIFAVILAALYGIYCYFNLDQSRLRGFTDTMRYGYGTAMMLTLLLGLVLRKNLESYGIKTIWLWVVILCALVALYLTKNRGAILGLLVGGIWLTYFWNKQLGKIVGVLAGGLITAMIGFYFFGKGESQSRLFTQMNNSSDQMRISQWQSAYYAFKEKPLLGWGPANFHSQVKRIKDEYDLGRKDYVDAHSHNMLLETLAGTGILGTICLLGWLFFWIKETYTGHPEWWKLLSPFFLTLMVSSQFEVITDANNAAMIYFLYSLSVVINSQKDSQKVPHPFFFFGILKISTF
jgi:O-antigen ligase